MEEQSALIDRRRPDRSDLVMEMVRRIVSVCNPDRVIVFGSYARGEVGGDSDVDFLVVKRLNGGRRQIRLAIRRALSGMGLPKDIIVVTPEEVERYGLHPGTIIRVALREGKVLYEREA